MSTTDYIDFAANLKPRDHCEKNTAECIVAHAASPFDQAHPCVTSDHDLPLCCLPADLLPAVRWVQHLANGELLWRLTW